MGKERILGLDLGTASIGFALIDYDRIAHKGKIVRMGVRVFPETLDAKTQVPLNQQRRTKRLVRRQTRRRRQRRRDLNEYLHSQDLLPEYGTPAWDEIMKKDPYELRKAGLRTKLERHELGRAIYHLAKRRHFLGRDIEFSESASEESSANPSGEEDAKTKQDRQELISELDRRDITLGEYLAALDSDERKRNRVASREVVRKEFNLLIEHQSMYHNGSEFDLAVLKKRLTDIIFYQKPTFWRVNTLGTCSFMPESRVCPSGSWIAYQRKMLEVINNIAILGNNEPLSPRARETLITACGEREGMTWTAVRKALKPVFQDEEYDLDYVKFNLEEDGPKKVPGNPIERKLRQIFGKDWQNHPEKDRLRASIHQDIYECDYEEIGEQRIAILSPEIRSKNRRELTNVLTRKYCISHDEASQLSTLKIKTGWEPYSTEAIRCFIAEMNNGRRMGELLSSPDYEEWRRRTFPNRIQLQDEDLKFLPSPKHFEEQKRLSRIKNPTVVRTSNELRKVVNNLIRIYGRPDLIRVELARDLRNTKKKRDQIKKNIRDNERRRRDAIENLRENHIQNPSRQDIEKWLLWKECGCRCPYTGKHISFNDLFGPTPSFEIEHIWPRSRSFDDSMANKTLCLSSENRVKGNRTPYEYMNGDEDRWFHLTSRLENIRRSSGNPDGMTPSKISRFHQKEIPADFTARQLRDTSYAAREAVSSLERLWSDKENPKGKVQAVSGRATAEIRRLWGLNGLVGGGELKTRDDHRHHAIDALTVACIYPGAIAALLKEYYLGKESYTAKPLKAPWITLREDAREHAQKIVVSHKVQRKVSGALHEETVYAKTPNEVAKNGKTLTQFVTRKNLDDLKSKQRDGIRDVHIRGILKNQTTNKSDVKIGHKGRVVKKVRVLVERDPALMKAATTGYVEPGSNHHMEIFKNSDSEVRIRVVSLMEAAARVHRKLSVVDRSMIGYKFLNSFSINESIQIDSGERSGLWVVTQIWNSGVLVLCNINASGDSATKPKWRPRAKTLVKEGYRKVSIDPIGNVRPAND